MRKYNYLSKLFYCHCPLVSFYPINGRFLPATKRRPEQLQPRLPAQPRWSDATGNIFVADMGNSRIRKVTPAGVVTSLVGSGLHSYYDSYDTLAAIEPWGLTVAASGDIYVAERSGPVIRKITPVPATRTLAGSGVAGYQEGRGRTAQFKEPWGIVVDKAGNAYVSDYLDNRIRKIAPDGTTSLFAGNGTFAHTDGVGAAASFQHPSGMTIDAAGNIYVYDNYFIRKITPGRVVTTMGSAGEHGAIALDAAGNIYATDPNNSYVLKVTPAGITTQFAHVPDFPRIVNGRVFYNPGILTTIVALPFGFGVSGNDQDTRFYMDQAGNFLDPSPPNVHYDRGSYPGWPVLSSITADASNHLYFGTYVGDVIDYSASAAPFIHVISGAEDGFGPGNVDGPNTVARLAVLMGATFGPNGGMYVADSANHNIRVLSK